MSYVYFFVCHAPNDTLHVKIGYTASHPSRRLKEVQGMCPVELNLFAFIKGDKGLEAKLHRTFAPLQYHHEWFLMERKLHDFVWYLVPDKKCVEPTPDDRFWDAVHDCILPTCAPHPSLDDEEYTNSVDMTVWEPLRAWITGDDAGTS